MYIPSYKCGGQPKKIQVGKKEIMTYHKGTHEFSSSNWPLIESLSGES